MTDEADTTTNGATPTPDKPWADVDKTVVAGEQELADIIEKGNTATSEHATELLTAAKGALVGLLRLIALLKGLV